jgi:hypothetical protein
MDTPAVHVRTTLDGREIAVIDGWLCLDGKPEVRELTALDEHPNRQAILKAVPLATHVGGRLALTLPEASVAQAALRRQQDTFDGSPRAVAERLRQTLWQKATAEGVE